MIKKFCWFLLLPCAIAFPLFSATCKNAKDYRIYDENTQNKVKDTYFENHTKQTVDFVLKKKKQYLSLNRAKLSIWDVYKLLSEFIDASDPDIELPQVYHAFQTAEALRKDGHPRWLILTGFIHDLGKILYYFGEPQWAVVGDTFPVGCAYSEKIVFPEFFRENPDSLDPTYQTKYGIYSKNCGFNKLHMSWGHDEYLYHVVKDYLPKEALYIIRFHSFYPAHKHGAYEYFMDEEDQELLPYLKLFSKYDLYSKSEEDVDIESLKPYYKELLDEFLPKKLNW